MVAWHHRLNEHEFEQAPGDSEGQGSRCIAVGDRVNLSGELESHLTCLDLNTPCPDL